jgi:ribose-phosphate pyrophosphokinase
MIKLNGESIQINSFPDGTILMKQGLVGALGTHIEWKYENDREFLALIYLVKHIRSKGITRISLYMPYVPNARMDRVKNLDDVFTLKYFAEVLNSLDLYAVRVLDPHSSVSEALINNLWIDNPRTHIESAICNINGGWFNWNTIGDNLLMFYPDEGAMKRYSGMVKLPCAFGIKKRDWETGQILGLDVSGNVDSIAGKDILIVDDICSRGGTFYHSAKKLKELGANKIYLYVTHCENTILEGDLLTSGLIEKVYTTNSIFTKEHDMIEVFEL